MNPTCITHFLGEHDWSTVIFPYTLAYSPIINRCPQTPPESLRSPSSGPLIDRLLAPVVLFSPVSQCLLYRYTFVLHPKNRKSTHKSLIRGCGLCRNQSSRSPKTWLTPPGTNGVFDRDGWRFRSCDSSFTYDEFKFLQEFNDDRSGEDPNGD